MVYKFSDVWCLSGLASRMFTVGAYKACDVQCSVKVHQSSKIRAFGFYSSKG